MTWPSGRWKLLAEEQFPRTNINWVMHILERGGFPGHAETGGTLSRAEPGGHGVQAGCLPSAGPACPPDLQALSVLAQWIREYKGPVHLEAEECFSQMRALLHQRFFVNLNRGPRRGCGAGRDGFSVSAGKTHPLPPSGTGGRLRRYHRGILGKIARFAAELFRKVDQTPEAPCSGCRLKNNCLPCMAAVNWELHGGLYMGDTSCPIRPQE